MAPLVAPDAVGLYCEAGDFHVDPWGAAPRALLTHAHADHARRGNGAYFCAAPGAAFVAPIAGEAPVRSFPYGEPFRLGEALVSFHPSGHALGAAQIRIEARGSVTVVSGDFRRPVDTTCDGFEVVRCDAFVTEATFALPIYRWPSPDSVIAGIHAWWMENRSRGRVSVLLAPSLGVAPRVLAGLHRDADTFAYAHDALLSVLDLYRARGTTLLETRPLPVRGALVGALIVAPPAVWSTPWIRRFASAETALVSGAMRVRGPRRRKGVGRGFLLSDHADWDELLRTIAETGASEVVLTHGYSHALARYLLERGVSASVFAAPYQAEGDLELPA